MYIQLYKAAEDSPLVTTEQMRLGVCAGLREDQIFDIRRWETGNIGQGNMLLPDGYFPISISQALNGLGPIGVMPQLVVSASEEGLEKAVSDAGGTKERIQLIRQIFQEMERLDKDDAEHACVSRKDILWGLNFLRGPDGSILPLLQGELTSRLIISSRLGYLRRVQNLNSLHYGGNQISFRDSVWSAGFSHSEVGFLCRLRRVQELQQIGEAANPTSAVERELVELSVQTR